jgi:hypothetical protein
MGGLSVGVDYMFEEADQTRRRAAITDYERNKTRTKTKTLPSIDAGNETLFISRGEQNTITKES